MDAESDDDDKDAWQVNEVNRVKTDEAEPSVIFNDETLLVVEKGW